MTLVKTLGAYSLVFCLTVEHICCSLSIVIEHKTHLYVLAAREQKEPNINKTVHH